MDTILHELFRECSATATGIDTRVFIPFPTRLQLTAYSMVALIFCLLTWLNVWDHADVVIVANNTELIRASFVSRFAISLPSHLTIASSY